MSHSTNASLANKPSAIPGESIAFEETPARTYDARTLASIPVRSFAALTPRRYADAGSIPAASTN